MNRTITALCLALAFVLAGCLFPMRRHHRPPPRHQHQPAPEPRPHEPEPEPPHEPEVPEHGERVPAPPAPPAQPNLTIRLLSADARAGQEVELALDLPVGAQVTILWGGKPLPKKTSRGGGSVIVTIPGDAQGGHFVVQWQGRSYQSRPVNLK